MNNKRFFVGAALLGCSVLFLYNHVTKHQSIEPRSLDDQMIGALQEYIQIDTTHPTPQYSRARSFLKQLAEKDGFAFQEVALPSGKAVAVITYPGSDASLPALLLNHHMDVVPVPNPSEWIAPPFAGEIKDGTMIGRGTQDMKGIGIVHYFALKALKDAAIQPKRTIHIIGVPDEEIGGFKGTKEFVGTQEFQHMNVGFVIDEGHASGIENQFDIKVAERKPIQVRITGKGELAHGSHLCCTNVNHELVAFLEHIRSRHEQEKAKTHTEQPGKLLALNITSLTSGARKENGHIALNVVPDTAEATIDIRVPPTMKRSEAISFLEETLQPFGNLSYEILAQAEEEPDLPEDHTPLYRALEKTITASGLSVQPHYFEGATDLRFYQARGIDGVGLTPFTVEDNIHGTNESVPVSQLIRAKNIMHSFITEFCT